MAPKPPPPTPPKPAAPPNPSKKASGNVLGSTKGYGALAGGPTPTTGMSKSDLDYQAESDHRTLSNATEIQGNPSRMAGVRKQHAKLTKQHTLVGRQIMSGSRR